MSSRTLRDSKLSVTKALPAAGANHNSATIVDLGEAAVAALEALEIEVVVPAIAAHIETDKYVTITFQDSANDSSFAAIAGAPSLAIVGVATTGSAAVTRKFKLPSTTRRYVQANLAVTTGAGALTGSSVTVNVLV
jgi:hypothetical protein